MILRKFLHFIEDKNHLILIAIVSIVIFSGIFYSLYIGNNFRFPDEQHYYKLAINIASIKQYSLNGKTSTAFRPPGYPLILSIFILIGAKVVHLRILNFIAIGLCIYILQKILKEHSSLFAGTISSLLVVCYPILFYTAGILYPQTIASLLFLLVILFSTRNTNSYGIAILSGFLLGYLILTIPIFAFILLPFAIYFLLFKRNYSLKRKGIILITGLFLISLWSARNYAVFNSFVLVSSNFGINLLLGNSENTTPNAGTNVDISKYSKEAAQLNEVESNTYYRKKAIEFILSHKIQAAKLYCQKFLNYFNYRNELRTKSETSPLKEYILLITYSALILLFAARILMIKLFKIHPLEVLLIIIYFLSAFVYSIFFTRIRFRLPFDFILIIVVSMFLGNIISRWLRKHGSVPSTSANTE
jgi:hypothetical protein